MKTEILECKNVKTLCVICGNVCDEKHDGLYKLDDIYFCGNHASENAKKVNDNGVIDF